MIIKTNIYKKVTKKSGRKIKSKKLDGKEGNSLDDDSILDNSIEKSDNENGLTGYEKFTLRSIFDI